MGRPFSTGSSIAIAETASSVTSLGAVWLLGKSEHLIAPARDYIAKHLVYPCERCMGAPAPKQTAKDWDPDLLAQAQAKATLLLKGAIMLATGFATHVPTQLALEGKWGNMKELRHVATGTAAGLGATLLTGWLAEKARPGSIEALEHKIQHAVDLPMCSHTEQACHSRADFCKLTVLEIPSSVMSGLVNYCFQRSRQH